MNEEFENLRHQIDEIDKQMADLFEQRMGVVKQIAEYKKKYNVPVQDNAREEEVLKRNCEYIHDDSVRHYYYTFMTRVMAESKGYQREIMNRSSTALNVSTSSGDYPVYIERGCLNRLNNYFTLNRKVLIITDTNVVKYYLSVVMSQLDRANTEVFVVPAGEKAKSASVFMNILEFMVSHEFTRTDCVVALGGGVVGDLAGFVASSYMRGIDFYNIPTSLLAQVDSSIGGKTAIDLAGLKNIVGAFYPPKAVLIDSNTLITLPQREISAGIAEVIKEALCFDPDLFHLIQTTVNPVVDIDTIIHRSLEIKKYVVEHDEKEAGLRKSLNFGHTFGHAIESFGEGKYLHGEAVAIGMLYCCDDKLKPIIKDVLVRAGLPYHTDFKTEDLIERLRVDKKAKGDKIDIVYLTDIGKFEIRKVSIDELKDYKGL